jgi:drug/metabolite transporter (DMT)-like permease
MWAMHGPFSNPWAGLLSRTEGPLKFRFFLQPAMAIFLAVRNGLKDSREGRPPYYWELQKDPAVRKQLVRDGWKSISKLFILAVALDCIYQLITLRWVYFIDAFTVAFVLAVIPYLILCGPVNRIATARRRAALASATEQPQGPSPLKRAG